MKEELVRAFYFHEWHRRDSLTAALNIPIGLATLIGGALVLLVQQYPTPYVRDLATSTFWLSVAGATVFLSNAAYLLIRSYYNYDYGRPSDLEQLRHFYEGLKSHHEGKSDAKDSAQESLEADFQDYLERVLSTAHKKNADNNKIKADYIHRAVGRLIIALVLTAVGTFPYLSKRIGVEAPETLVRVVDSIRVEEAGMTNRYSRSDEGVSQEAANEEIPPPPERPPEPPVDYTSETPPMKVE